jgi:hypothetical protein
LFKNTEELMKTDHTHGFLPAAIRTFLGCGIAIFLIAQFHYRKSPVSKVPNSYKPPKFDPHSVPTLRPIGLAPDTIERFVRWVASVPVSDVQRIRDEIATAHNDELVLGALFGHLFQLPVADFGRHLLLLAIVGELRHPKSVKLLIKFVNLPADSVFAQSLIRPSGGSAITYPNYSAALQARAAEMLAYIRTPDALGEVLRLASEHDSRTVRLAALDAFIFNHDDSPEAMDRARAAARPGEAKFVGLARRERGCNPNEFEAKVRAFYERYPEENPPDPSPLCTPDSLSTANRGLQKARS